ncbi:uncharacterized protein [Penaeus vannamei]|uniref:uncharacterized protein n=1 Tax=Penaeus vannamei TaxID=6689 RepID=UPI00387F57CC
MDSLEAWHLLPPSLSPLHLFSIIRHHRRAPSVSLPYHRREFIAADVTVRARTSGVNCKGSNSGIDVVSAVLGFGYRVVVEVLAPQSSVMLERLLPLTQYQVHVSIIGNNSALWTSPVVTFHTTRDDVFQVFNNSTPTIIDAIDVSVGGIEGSDVTPLENLGGLDQKVGLVRVRAEEVGIVLLVLAVWMFAIALFFNRWGKIRMLEPYQEPYKEAPPQLLQHRPSCPMADPYALPTNPLKIEHNGRNRPRQNSVFVGRTRSLSLEVHPPRRVKSALNLTTMVLQESEEEAGGVATTFT